MTKLLALAIVPFAMLASACTPQLQTALVQTCQGLNEAYSYYDEIAAQGIISQRTMNKVSLVRGQTEKLCADPSNATPLTVTRVAAQAYVVLNAAFKEGGQSNSARLGYSKVQNLKRILEEAKQ